MYNIYKSFNLNLGNGTQNKWWKDNKYDSELRKEFIVKTAEYFLMKERYYFLYIHTP